MTESSGVVRFEGTTIRLTEHYELSIGRGSEADIRVGRNPTDSRVSREHLVLSMVGGLVTVTRRSESQPVIVRSPGADYTLNRAGEAVTRGGAFDILLPKTPDIGEEQPAYYRLTVWTPSAGSQTLGTTLRPQDGTATGTQGLPELSLRERQLLSAYARPLLAGGDGARPSASTHRQASADLNYSYDWVREQIDGLRARLAAEGWPVGSDKDSLALWAVTAGLITAADLTEFDLA
jgi:hypothetical protein